MFDDVNSRGSIQKALKLAPVAALVYVAVSFIINIGYIGEIGYWSILFFGAPDMIQVSSSIFRVILFYMAVSSILYMVHSMFELNYNYRMYTRIAYDYIVSDKQLLAYIFALPYAFITILNATGYINIKKQSLHISLFPDLLLIASGIVYLLWINSSGTIARLFFIFVVIGLVLNTSSVGTTWALADRVSNTNIVSIYLSSGGCYTTRLVRVVSSGFILYNEYSMTYEFRRLDTINVVHPGAKCV